MRGWRPGGVFDLEVVEERPGFLVFLVRGKEADEAFKDESGGMRWQRVPPGEKRGRVHTSTVTVAVLPEPGHSELKVDPRDLEWSTCRGSGAGGQHRNKTESAVQLRHVPTGTTVRCESERSQHQNRANALATLRARLWQDARESALDGRNADRRSQVGSGMRGDKVRTYRTQDDSVTDHRTGRRASLRDVMRGILDGLR